MTDPSDPGLPAGDAPDHGLPAGDAPDHGLPAGDAPDHGLPDPGLPDRGLPPGDMPDSGLATPPARPGIFSLDGRAVPGLYLVGWIASVMGLAVLVVSFLSAGSAAARWLFLGGLVVLTLGIFAAAGSQAVERSKRKDLAYRGPSPVLAFILVVPVTLLGILVVLAPLSALGLDARSPAATTVSLALTMLVYAGVIRLLVVGPGALSWPDMGMVRPSGTAARDLLLGAMFAVPVLAVTLLLAGVLSRFLQPAPSALPAAGDALGLVLNLVSAAVLAPIGEELFFRGFATTAWARALGIGPAVVRGAVFFAIAHVVTLFDTSFAEGAQRALFSFVGLLPVGVALGWLFLRRGSLYAAIGLHAAFNGIQVVILFLAASSAS